MATYKAMEIYSTFAESNVQDNNPSGWYECYVQGSNSYLYRSFLKHDIADIPYKSKIISAKLRLYQSYKNDNGDNGTTNIAKVTQNWVDSEVNWNNQPETTGRYLAQDVPPPGVGNWTDWDITTLVQEWVDQTSPNYGLMIINNNEGEYRVGWRFYNRHYSNGEYATYIEIEYEPEEEFRISKARMTEMAEQAREVIGVEDELNPGNIVSIMDYVNDEVDSQFSLIAQISAALEGKAAGGGSGSSGATIGSATAKVSSYATSTSISFTGLTAQPKMFCIIPTGNITLGASRYVTGVMYDGSKTHGTYGYRSGSSATSYYSATYFTWTYSNGTLTVQTSSTTNGGYFSTGATYLLIYAV